jgi:diaminopimelate decarboxylase
MEYRVRGTDGLPVYPLTAKANPAGRLEIGGIDTKDLIAEYGSPLYVFDEQTVRSVALDFMTAFGKRHPAARVVYACKAFANVGLIKLLADLGLGFDVVSGGEIAAIEAAGVDAETVFFHGNNKSESEIERAVSVGIGRVVVDNPHEIDLLEAVLERLGSHQKVMLRVSPGVDPHTHAHTTTGVLDSKFGLPIVTGDAEAAMARIMASERIQLTGIHFHLGSPIFDLEPYREAIEIVLDFAKAMRDRYGFVMEEISPGGGFAVRYLLEDEPPTPDAYAEEICSALEDGCRARGLELPAITIEPGRAIVGRAGVALYTVGAIKIIPSLRTYVAVDGGMGDNIRPAIYGSRYEAAIANRFLEPSDGPVTIAGKYCESGDILVKDYDLPSPSAGDTVAIPVSGAYCLAMASNYNLNSIPAAVLVRDGESRLLRRRQTDQDLMAFDAI